MLRQLTRQLRQQQRTLDTITAIRCASSGATPSGTKHDEQMSHFGFQTVDASAKAGMVGEVFRSVAPSYDIMNDLMSGGMHRLWKDRLVSQLRPFAGMQHLDVAGGTGDVAFRVLGQIRQAESEAPSVVPESL